MPIKEGQKFLVTGIVELRKTKFSSEAGAINRSSKSDMNRLQAQASERIVDPDTGETVGWIYQWNTGEICPRWKSEPRTTLIDDQRRSSK